MKSPLAHHSPSRQGAASRRGQDRISLTPMIDIVFLLIIFFLVSSHLSRQENRHPVTLAQADGGQPDELDTTPVTLTVDAAGKLFFGSEPLPREELRDRLAAHRQTRSRGPGLPNVRVRLRIDQAVPYRDVEPILKELAEQGVADVSIVVGPRNKAISPMNSK